MAALLKFTSIARSHRDLIPRRGSHEEATWVIAGLRYLFTGEDQTGWTGPMPLRTVPEALIEAVRTGHHPDQAAHFAGIWPQTADRWTARGLTELARMTTTNDETPQPSEEPYAHFALNLLHAEAAAEIDFATRWQAHFPKDWRAIERYMERRWRTRWGREPTKVELSGPGGGPVPIVAEVIRPDEAEAILARAEARGAAVAAESAPLAVGPAGAPGGAPVDAEQGRRAS